MSEPSRIFLTSGLTIFGGLFVLVLGHLVLKWVIDPLHEFRMLVGEIAFAIVFYANATNMPELSSAATPAQATRALRSLAGELYQRMYAIPAYSLWAFLRVVPSKRDVTESAQQLIGYSNSFGTGSRDRSSRIHAIATSLRIPGDL